MPRISVLPLTKTKEGSYTYILYDLLKKKYKVNIIGLNYGITLPQLLFGIGSRSIIHLHWIEHKYTLGMVNRFGWFSKFLVLFTLPLFVLFIFMLNFLGCPIVTTLHNVEPHRVLFHRLEKSAFAIVLRLSKIVYVHTEVMKSMASTQYGVASNKIRRIDHGNWAHLNSNLYTPTTARQILDIDSDSFVMCFIGRMSPDKGLHLLLDCLTEVSAESSLYLILAGAPSNRKYLKNLSQKIRCIPLSVKIRFYPYRISQSFLELLIKACNVGVLPYTKTSTPSTVLLFMSFGRPVITPEFPSVKEFVGTDYPLLYDGSAKGLLRTIERTISERTELIEIGEEMLERAQNFDWDQTALITYKNYLELYSKDGKN